MPSSLAAAMAARSGYYNQSLREGWSDWAEPVAWCWIPRKSWGGGCWIPWVTSLHCAYCGWRPTTEAWCPATLSWTGLLSSLCFSWSWNYFGEIVQTKPWDFRDNSEIKRGAFFGTSSQLRFFCWTEIFLLNWDFFVELGFNGPLVFF